MLHAEVCFVVLHWHFPQYVCSYLILAFLFNFSTHTIMCLHCFSFASICLGYMCVPVSHRIISRLCICCLFLFEICLSHDIWFCNACYCAAMISLSISPFRSSSRNQWNVPSWLNCCLFILLMHWTSFTLLSHFFL